jgi:hypothetical protein
MSRAARTALLLALLLLSAPAAPPASAQGETRGPGIALGNPHAAEPGSGIPDVPTGPGAIRGRVLHESTPDRVSGLPVILYALPRRGAPGLRGSTTNATGEFAFEDLATDPDTSYLVGVRFAGIPFGMRTAFSPGETERIVEVTVSDPTAEAGAIEVGEVLIRIERGCDDLRVIETLAVRNPSQRVFFVPESERGERPPIAEMLLPEGASEVQVPFGSFPQGLDQEGRQLRFWGPLYPGGQEIEFGYGLAAGSDASTLERGFPVGAERVIVMTPAAGPAPEGDGLRAVAETQLDNQSYHTAVAEDVAAGTTLALRVGALERSDAVPGVSLIDSRMWLELDDAALVVDERYSLENTTDAPIGSVGDAPLLCIPLPAGAEALRFSQSAMSLGLSRDPSGSLAVSGPAPPGGSTIALRYLLPVDDERVEFVRRFEQPFPLLSIMIADTSLVTDSDRLHRLRPIRSEDRSYLHLEAFEIERGETVTLGLEPLAAPRAISTWAAALLLGLMSLATVAFLAAPLGGGPRRSAAEGVSPNRVERESVLHSMRDLDHDYETGKIAEADYQTDRHALQARAVALLRSEDSARAEHDRSPAEGACPSCGTTLDTAWRFCASCGAGVVGSPAEDEPSQGAA